MAIFHDLVMRMTLDQGSNQWSLTIKSNLLPMKVNTHHGYRTQTGFLQQTHNPWRDYCAYNYASNVDLMENNCHPCKDPSKDDIVLAIIVQYSTCLHVNLEFTIPMYRTVSALGMVIDQL